MSTLALIAYGVFFGSVALAVGASLVSVMWARASTIGYAAGCVAGAVGLFGLAQRWYVAGHPPIFGTFENTYTAAWALMVTAALLGVRTRYRGAWRLTAPWALAFMLWGTRYRKGPTPLTISEQSLWVDVHVMFAWICFVALLLLTSVAIQRLRGRIPFGMDENDSEEAQLRFLLVGFAAMTLMLATGSWYSYLLFGAFWQWEVVETMSLVAWLGYSMIIHSRLFGGLRGRKFDAAVVAVLPALLLTFFIWSVYPNTFHYFDIPLVKPY